MKRIVMDIDGTISHATGGDYRNAEPDLEIIETLRQYSAEGFEIVLATSRNMRTYAGNVGKINARMLPVLVEWLRVHDVPYDEIWTGKPWCGTEGFYVDDKAIRPSEFVDLTYAQIEALIGATK